LSAIGRHPVAPTFPLQYPVGIQAECTVEEMMAWTTPTLVEICIGLEINGYLPAEF
jgi:coenzyme PQQ precursor peptide PqqA